MVIFLSTPLTNKIDKNFMIKSHKILMKNLDIIKKESNDDQLSVTHTNSIKNQTESESSDPIPLFIVKMRLNQKNLQLLYKRGGCHYLIINAFTLSNNEKKIA